MTAETVASGEWVCVAVFEFDDGKPERQELYRGDESACTHLAAMLERVQEDGRGLRYSGSRTGLLHAIVAVASAQSLEDEE